MAQSRSQSDLQFECVLIGNQRQTMHDVNAQLSSMCYILELETKYYNQCLHTIFLSHALNDAST